MNAELWIFLSYVGTVIAFPMAIAVFLYEKRKERANEEEEVFELLSASYQDFLKLALENPDLRLLSKARTRDLTDEQNERMRAIFGLLIALFERAYLLLYDRKLKGKQRRWPTQLRGPESQRATSDRTPVSRKSLYLSKQATSRTIGNRRQGGFRTGDVAGRRVQLFGNKRGGAGQ